MKILVLGAGGMVGHKMYEKLSKVYPETFGSVHRGLEAYKDFSLFDESHLIANVEVEPFSNLLPLLNQLKPDVILNCIGITLRKKEISDLKYCVDVNSLLPQLLKCWCAQNDAKLIQFSTDCVFSGAEGNYREDSFPTATDVYGKTKYLGEVQGKGCLTLRGSMIGREIHGKTELLEWALSQKPGSTIKGYRNAIYSGVTTTVMAELVVKILAAPKFLEGVYQVSSEPISKFELLQKINSLFKLDLNVNEDTQYVSKKVLISEKIRQAIGFQSPTWDEMLSQLASGN